MNNPVFKNFMVNRFRLIYRFLYSTIGGANFNTLFKCSAFTTVLNFLPQLIGHATCYVKETNALGHK